jgi:hypothetical protein
MFFPDPDFLPSQISDPIRTKKRRGKKFCPTFFAVINFTQMKIVLFFEKMDKELKYF